MILRGDDLKLSHQKLKLLYLMKILLEKTDEENSITVPQMIEQLKKYGISAERKSIYDDLEYLKLFGLDIICRKSKTYDYFVASRDFELPELKLLVDSVQSSKFITHKKSLELISKIEKLTSENNAKKLHGQVFVTNRIKTLNEKIYYNVDTINEAIFKNKQISFLYFDWTVNKKKKYRKDGSRYIESPIAFTWDEEKYYLITYKSKYSSYTHYRVDKMELIEICENDRIMPPEEFDLALYDKSIFSMYAGEETDVTIMFKNELVGVVFDRFGMDVPILKADAESFVARIKVILSPHFYSWLVSFGNKVKIISPDYVKDEMCELLNNVIKQYEV